MIITVTHLTRMRPPHFCVAGLEGKKAIRPVTSGQLHKRLLRCNGGPFAIGAIVDIGPVRDVGSAPELEDRRFDPARVRYVGMKTAKTFWEDLKGIAQPSLDSIFGDDLVKRGRWSCGVDPGHGVVSLGCMQVFGAARIFTRGLDPQPTRAGVRLAITDPVVGKLDLGITDVRFFEEDFITVREDVVANARDRIASGTRLLLSVGLTRATVPPDRPLHWLQVNNIHFENDPIWSV